MERVTKAVVLAAGFGKRLRPFTDHLPKPLLPVAGEPILSRVLDALADWGVTDVRVNAHWFAGKVAKFADAWNAVEPEMKVAVAEERDILGTGGVLKPLAAWLGDEPFYLVNGDVVFSGFDPAPLADAFERSGRFAACWMSETDGPRTIEADPDGRVCCWKSPDPGVSGTYTYCGVALLSPAVIGYLPAAPFCSIVDAYERAMMEDGRFVVGVTEPEAAWCDAGTLDVFRELNRAAGTAVSVSGTENARLEALARALGWDPAASAADALGVRGSDRAFWRLTASDGRTAIAVEYDSGSRPENARYAAAARALAAAGVDVARVLADLPAERALALEDLRGGSLEERANAKGASLMELYRPVVAALKAFHGAGTEAARELELEPPFDAALYAWERELFLGHCVRARYGIDDLPEAVERELEGAAILLGREPPVLVHRDCQSSNVLYREDGSCAFIDFQGMRMGPAVYDLASLLYDPYVPLTANDRAALAREYGADRTALAVGAVQRLAQALGAFGRLAAAGQPQFARHVPRALANLHEAAHAAAFPALAEFSHELVRREELRGGIVP